MKISSYMHTKSLPGFHRHPLSKLSLYLITDRRILPKGKNLLETIEAALKGGVRAVQLREKDLPARELYKLALDLRRLTQRFEALLFINDRIDVALAVKADGVHLGGHSLPVEVVRKLVGPEMLIGVSTHSLEELETAQKGGADFVTFGPVYFTPSKARFGSPVGIEALKRACEFAELPVLGLGGVKLDRIPEVMRAGASGVSLISAILTAEDPEKAARALTEKIKSI